jgi:hypothetical protein
MTVPTLQPHELALLRECPLAISNAKGQRLYPSEKARMSQLKVLWAWRFVSGRVDDNGLVLRFTLTDRGREALGLPTTEATNAPAA